MSIRGKRDIWKDFKYNICCKSASKIYIAVNKRNSDLVAHQQTDSSCRVVRKGWPWVEVCESRIESHNTLAPKTKPMVPLAVFAHFSKINKLDEWNWSWKYTRAPPERAARAALLSESHGPTRCGIWCQTPSANAVQPPQTLRDPLLTPHVWHEEGVCVPGSHLQQLYMYVTLH